MRRVWDKRTGFQAEKVAAAGAANLPLFILLFLRLYNIDHKDEFNVRLNFLSAKSAAGTATTVVSSQNLFRILPACIRRISQPDFETGPELRVILAFCTSSSSNHSSLSQESCIEFIGLLSDAIQPRVVQLFRQTSVSRTAAVATSLASNTAKRSHLWINSVLRFITGPIFLKIHFSMIQMFCTSFFTVPALCALLDNQAVEILAKSNLLDTIVHNTASLSFFLSECEAESALFLLANVICLFRRIKETPGLSCATVKAELNQAFIIPALLHIHTCASKASYTQHSSTQHHPIFGWSNRSLLHKHKHYDSFDAEGLLRMVISHQLSYIWSTPYIEDTFVSILEFDTAALAPSSLLVNNNSTANLPSSSSSIISKLGKFLSLSINSNSTNQASQVLSVTTIQAASLYLNLWTCLPPHRTNILNALAYNIPGLIPKLWQFIESDIGLDVFLRIVENSSASFSSSCSLAAEPLVTVLYVFCEACGILFLTLDDEDLYELERP